MPDVSFVLPHWLYWSTLLLIPVLAMYTVRRQKRMGAPARRISLPIAYMLWLTGGFVGLHRFYLRSRLGAVYIPLFLTVVYGNVQGNHARDAVSHARNALLGAKFDVERAQAAVSKGVEGAAAQLAKAQQALAAVNAQMAASTADFDFWQTFSLSFALAIAILLLIDAFLLPRLMRRFVEREGVPAPIDTTPIERVDPGPGPGTHEDPTLKIHTRFTDGIDTLNGWIGEFVCYWSIIAVFVYYYEVLARYIFNSPTNWAHEGMFLMFGMQYVISGGFASREDAHVRVDVLYLYLPTRGKAVVDIITSIFFFLFTGALLWTGWIFMVDAITVWEVSFTEWAIQYWPVKSTLAVGALLIVLQGIAKLVKDVLILMGKGT